MNVAKEKTAETLKSLAVHSRFKTSYVSFRRLTPGRSPCIPRHFVLIYAKRKKKSRHFDAINPDAINP